MPAAAFGATGIGPEELLSVAGQSEKKAPSLCAFLSLRAFGTGG